MLPAIYFSCPILKNDILRLTHYKAAYPQSDTTLVLYNGYIDDIYNDWLYSMLDALKEEFLTSAAPCRLRVIIECFFHCSISMDHYNLLSSLHPESFHYCLENNRTKEVLQLNQITTREAEEKFGVALYDNAELHVFQRFFIEDIDAKALILERFSV